MTTPTRTLSVLTHAAAAAALLLPCSGCLGAFALRPDWDLTGDLEAHELEPGESEVELTLGRGGEVRVEGEPLRLDSVREVGRFGLTLVDAGAIPRPWRTPHLADGGPVVSRIAAASPLAKAGLHPWDVVREVNGSPVTDAGDVLRRLEAVAPGDPVWLSVRGPFDDEPRDVVASEVGSALDDRTSFAVPFLFELETSPHASFFWFPEGILLGGVLFARFEGYTVEPSDGLFDDDGWNEWKTNDYFAYSSWQTLAGLIRWKTSKNVRTGEERSTLRLFWFLDL